MRRILASLVLALLATTVSAQCAFTKYGTSCGPVFTGKATPNGNTTFVTMTASKVAPTSRILIIVGAVKTDIDLRPIFGGTLNCRLVCRMDFLQQHRPDSNGRYVWGHALPSTHRGIAFAQFAELRADGSVRTSNGLQLVCK